MLTQLDLLNLASMLKCQPATMVSVSLLKGWGLFLNLSQSLNDWRNFKNVKMFIFFLFEKFSWKKTEKSKQSLRNLSLSLSPMVCVIKLFSREYWRGKFHFTVDLLFDWFGISCLTTDNFCFYLQNRLIRTSQNRRSMVQWYVPL